MPAIFGGVYLLTRYPEELGVITVVLLPDSGRLSFVQRAATSYIEANAPGTKKGRKWQ
jgi:hypothetical protein